MSQGLVLADLPADVRPGVAGADAERGELLGDLRVGQRRGERDVGVAAVVVVPGGRLAGPRGRG